ncbi:MAG TPA: ABC-type transport auxiliary lipoprotein family protein [Gemmatimonadaceae bacterium]|nr:ABC-type transport auxiliary lipoprotein family protein [Gemmatimonadaceae bacterium]
MPSLRLTLRLLPLIAALGCPLLGRNPPPRELYRLALPEALKIDSTRPAAVDGGNYPLDGTLAITQYVAPGIYGDPGIVFRIDDTQYGSYPNREWAVPIGEQMGMLTERVLARMPLTAERAVFDPPSQRSQTYIWRATIREFEEVDRGSRVFAAVRIDARIVRASDDSILWSGTSHIERGARSSSMPGIVQTLSDLAAEAVTDLVTRARAELKGRRP